MMKKKILSIILLGLFSISLVACGNDGKEPSGSGVGTLKDYADVPFSIFVERELEDGEKDIQNFVFGTFPDKWKDVIFDTISYYDYFRKNYGFGAMETPVVREGTKLTMDFGGYQPDKITVYRDPNTYAVLSAKETPNEEIISEVAVKNNSFIVEYGEDSLLYYVISCEWEGAGTVKYGIIVSK